jgi:hypothetical protein
MAKRKDNRNVVENFLFCKGFVQSTKYIFDSLRKSAILTNEDNNNSVYTVFPITVRLGVQRVFEFVGS